MTKSDVEIYLVKYYQPKDEDAYHIYDCFETMEHLQKEVAWLRSLPLTEPNRPYKLAVQIDTCLSYELLDL